MPLRQFSIPNDECASFGPLTLDMLERVVEEAWQEVSRRKGSQMSQECEKLTRELMAHRVIARAMRGETDPSRLKEHALWDF